MTTPPLTEEQQAKFLRESSGGVYLASSVGACLGNVITPPGFKLYLEEVRQAAGNSPHPLEQMLWEQFVIAHHNLGRLYSQASGSKTIDEVQAYSAVVLKLHSELRQLAETLHRLSKAGLGGAGGSSTPPPMTAGHPTDSGERDTQLTSNSGGNDEQPTVVPFTEPAPRRRRPAKSTAAARAYG